MSVTGTVSLSVDVSDAQAAGTTRLTAYTIPVKPATLTTSYTNGSAANMVSKTYQRSASLVATTIDLDLTALVANDDSVGFTHVREVIIYNDDATAAGAKVLTVGLGTNPFSYWLGGTTPTFILHPSTAVRFSCPLQTAGWLVDATHKILRLDSGANTVAYRIVILGD